MRHLILCLCIWLAVSTLAGVSARAGDVAVGQPPESAHALLPTQACAVIDVSGSRTENTRPLVGVNDDLTVAFCYTGKFYSNGTKGADHTYVSNHEPTIAVWQWVNGQLSTNPIREERVLQDSNQEPTTAHDATTFVRNEYNYQCVDSYGYLYGLRSNDELLLINDAAPEVVSVRGWRLFGFTWSSIIAHNFVPAAPGGSTDPIWNTFYCNYGAESIAMVNNTGGCVGTANVTPEEYLLETGTATWISGNGHADAQFNSLFRDARLGSDHPFPDIADFQVGGFNDNGWAAGTSDGGFCLWNGVEMTYGLDPSYTANYAAVLRVRSMNAQGTTVGNHWQDPYEYGAWVSYFHGERSYNQLAGIKSFDDLISPAFGDEITNMKARLVSNEKSATDKRYHVLVSADIADDDPNNNQTRYMIWTCDPAQPEDKQWTYAKVQWPPNTYVSEIVAINPDGVMTAIGSLDITKDTHTTHVMLLVPVDMQVDANRDGQISPDRAAPAASQPAGVTVPPPDITLPERPYRFWINDDDDGEENSYALNGSEKVPASQKDYSRDTLVTKRGLEDFARLWLHLPFPGQLLKNGGIRLGLRWKPNPLHPNAALPKIKLFRAANKTDDYLTDDGQAATQVTFDPNHHSIGALSLCHAIWNEGGNAVVDGGNTFVFPAQFWQDVNVSKDQPDVYLLFEGVGDGGADTGGQGCLEYVILDKDGHEQGHVGGLYMEVLNIKNMYERAKTTPDDLALPFSHERHNFPDERPSGLTVELPEYQFRVPWNETPQCLVFVHGWDMNPQQYLSYSETCFKRLWWQGYKGRFASLYWITLTGKLTYNGSEYRAWKYGKSLQEYVEYFRGKLSSPMYSMNVMAHSMGNVVTCSAIQQGLHLNNYFMMQAALPSGCFSDNDTVINSYPKMLDAETQRGKTPDFSDPEWGYRSYLKNSVLGDVSLAITPNVSNVISFYNIEDFALNAGNSFMIFPHPWTINEADFKPAGDINFPPPAWQFFYDSMILGTPSQKAAMKLPVYDSDTGSVQYYIDHSVTDHHEMMAFVARPRSRGAGAEPRTGTSLFGPDHAFDLEEEGGLTGERLDHDGEFERPIQRTSGTGSVRKIYKRIFDTLTGFQP